MNSVEMNQKLILINQCILKDIIKGGKNVIYYWSTCLLKTNRSYFIDYFT